MSEYTTNNQNLKSYYTTSTKVEKPERIVVSGPENIPIRHSYNDREATERMRAINTDIYEGTKNEKKKSGGGALGFATGVAAVFLSLIGIKYIVKFFRKS